jgi:hypothetical protein
MATPNKRPVKPTDIPLRETRFDTDQGVSWQQEAPREISLQDKLVEYIIRLGYTNLHVLNIIVQLFTIGKVRIEFAKHVERLELMNESDKMTSGEAVALLDAYMASLPGSGPSEEPLDPDRTGKIIVRFPGYPNRDFSV